MFKNLKLFHGFHLIELLSVMAIIGIVTALGIPVYTQYLVEARRMQAITYISKLALAMEEFHLEHQTYSHATLAALHFPEKIAGNYYHLKIKNATPNDYLLLAIPLGRQAKNDSLCANLILDARQRKNISGKGSVADCW